MEAAFVEFLSQWKNLLVQYQQRTSRPVLRDLVDEYDYIVSYVDSVHPGFAVHATNLGVGSFSGRFYNESRYGFARSSSPIDVTMQFSGETTRETTVESAIETIRRVEEVIDLTLD